MPSEPLGLKDPAVLPQSLMKFDSTDAVTDSNAYRERVHFKCDRLQVTLTVLSFLE